MCDTQHPINVVSRETLLEFAAIMPIDGCTQKTTDEIRRLVSESATTEQLRLACRLDLDVLSHDAKKNISNAEDGTSKLSEKITSVTERVIGAERDAANAKTIFHALTAIFSIAIVIGAISGFSAYSQNQASLRESRESLEAMRKSEREARDFKGQIDSHSRLSEIIVFRRVIDEARAELPGIFADSISDPQIRRLTEISEFFKSIIAQGSFVDENSKRRLNFMRSFFDQIVKYGKLKSIDIKSLENNAKDFEILLNETTSEVTAPNDDRQHFFENELPGYISNIIGVIKIRIIKDQLGPEKPKNNLDSLFESADRLFIDASERHPKFANPHSNRSVVVKYRFIDSLKDELSQYTDDELEGLIKQCEIRIEEGYKHLDEATRCEPTGVMQSVISNNRADWQLTLGRILLSAMDRPNLKTQGKAKAAYEKGMQWILQTKTMPNIDPVILVTEAEFECMAIALRVPNENDVKYEMKLKKILALLASAVDHGYKGFPSTKKELSKTFNNKDREWWHFAIEQAKDNGNNSYGDDLLKAAYRGT
ncbi:MAG: hypothetical protein ACKO38_17960 [Planctomycetota bacterium]